MVVNKWDLVGEEERFMFERSFEKDLTHLTWAARVNLSALTGWHTNRLKRSMDEALTNWDRRISTGKLNTFLGELVSAHPHPVRGGKQPKILFATQATTRPPTFVLFTHEGGRPRGRLGRKQDLGLLAAAHGVRVSGDQFAQERVELARGDAAVPFGERLVHGSLETVGVPSGQCR